MRRWVCIILMITLSSMHGIFEAAGSLSFSSDLMDPPVIEANIAFNGDIAKCCAKQKIDLSEVVFHCPLDGKILSTSLDLVEGHCGQKHEAFEPYSLADSFRKFVLRPPIA